MDRNRAKNQPPSRFRAQTKNIGIRPGVDRENGVIRGLAIMSKGEALGHSAWVDGVMLSQVETLGNKVKKGVKARFTHPGLSSDGLGKLLGSADNFQIPSNGGVVLGDITFVRSAFKTPDGDLATYVMDLAEETPEKAGLSIVFERDFGEEDRFRAEHEDKKGRFRSPDKKNVDNLDHFRIAKLRAADVVDEPAANPKGLFFSEDNLAKQADELLKYVFGLTNEKPESQMFDIDADRVKIFADQFIDRNSISVNLNAKEGLQMPTEQKDATVEEIAVAEKAPPDKEALAKATEEAKQEELSRILTIQEEGAELQQEELAAECIKADVSKDEASRKMVKQALIDHKATLAKNQIGHNGETNLEPVQDQLSEAEQKGTEVNEKAVAAYLEKHPDVDYEDAMRAVSKKSLTAYTSKHGISREDVLCPSRKELQNV